MKFLSTLVLIGLLAGSIAAQGTSSGLSILKVPTNALQASLGAAAVTSQGSPSAASLNPASIVVDDQRLSIHFTHTSWFEGISAQHLLVSLPTPFGRFYLRTGMSSIPDIEVRTQPGPPASTFSARTAVFGAGWGTSLTDGIVLGGAASYYYDRLYDVEATGLAGSIGLLATGLMEQLTIGASVTDLGSVSGYKGTTSDLPTRVTVGAAYDLPLGDFTFVPAMSYQSVRSGASGIHAGGSISYAFLTVRGTIRTGETAQLGSVGASVSYQGLAVEYALVPFASGLGSGHFISVGIHL